MSVEAKTNLKKLIRPLIFMAVGAVAGLLYYFFIDSASGLGVSMVFGTVTGFVASRLFSKDGCCSCGGGSCNIGNDR